MCHCNEYKLSALQVKISEKKKLNATTQQFITAKISGCALKQGRETHSSMPGLTKGGAAGHPSRGPQESSGPMNLKVKN